MGPVWCLITNRALSGDNWQEAVPRRVYAACRAGVHLIHVREPGLEGGALYDLVAACVTAARGTPGRVVVNDRLDVAIAAGAHGVHLRGDSMPAWRVRSHVPRSFLLGQSIHSVGEAIAADVTFVDYLVFGTVFSSASKPGIVPAGLDALRAVVAATTLPVLAVGGVTLENMPAVMATGAAGAAAISLFAGGRE